MIQMKAKILKERIRAIKIVSKIAKIAIVSKIIRVNKGKRKL
jgi:hypothetical protein